MEPRRRAVRGGPNLSSVSVVIQVVTPILGGSSRIREIDDVDVIRPPSVRGHLRFWWRALRGHEPAFASPEELHRAEACLWGRAATDTGGRSTVEVRIEIVGTPVDLDTSNVHPTHTAGAYALWPARAESGGKRAAPRRKAGTRFRLTVTMPADQKAEVRDAVRAWILFGGYGSRARRGLGSLTVVEDPAGWLPAGATREELAAVFGRDVLAAPARPADQTPWLAGAALHVGRATRDAEAAWREALGWLQEFRQDWHGRPGDRAREPGSAGRPSISNWPEADKVRHLTGRTRGHAPRHNPVPAWPRAGFGLPIVGRFQDRARDGGRLEEPGPFTLSWQESPDQAPISRLASPLVVKALPLASGEFVPCALWLERANPVGQVVLEGVPGSAAPFDRLVAPGDTARFPALEGGDGSLRTAFLTWLQRRHHTTAVAP